MPDETTTPEEGQQTTAEGASDVESTSEPEVDADVDPEEGALE